MVMSSSADVEDVEDVEDLECIGSVPDGSTCRGPVELRWPLSGSGRWFPRCEAHWDERLRVEEELRARYPQSPPRDWSPLDAGESWDEVY